MLLFDPRVKCVLDKKSLIYILAAWWESSKTEDVKAFHLDDQQNRLQRYNFGPIVHFKGHVAVRALSFNFCLWSCMHMAAESLLSNIQIYDTDLRTLQMTTYLSLLRARFPLTLT